MAYILTTDGRNNDVDGAFRRYRKYVETNRERFPASGYALAQSDWYFDHRDHRCPHDAWLEALDLTEASSGERSEKRALSMRVRLLGAYHDGYIELYYPRVLRYALKVVDGEHGHRDWCYDELRLSKDGNLIHEVEWRGPTGNGVWLIEASDLEFKWTPK
jgi:hypothetical protein